MTHRLTHSMTARVSQDRLWALVENVEDWPRFLPTMTHVRLLDPLEPGARAAIKQPLQPEATWIIEHLEPPRRLSWSTKAGPLTLLATHTVVPHDEGSTQILDLVLSGPMATPTWLLAGWLLWLTIAYENRCFRLEAER